LKVFQLWCTSEIKHLQNIIIWCLPYLRGKTSCKISTPGLDINVCPIPVKTDVWQVDLVLWLSDGTSEKIRDSQTCRYDGQIYCHWYKILGLLYKRAPFDLQFVHNLFWLKLKWNVRSKLFYFIIYRSSMLWWSSRTLTKLKSQSQKRFNERKYKYLKYKNKNHSGTDT
jgi:hypothetical protein